MAAELAKKGAARKTTRKSTSPSKAGAKKSAKARSSGTRGASSKGEEQDKGQAKKRLTKLDRKKLGAMVDRMLMQLAEQVEGGECKITTSEGVRLIQLREALGLDKPSKVKVEWVEPKAA